MGFPAGASLAFFIASSNFFARMSSLLVSWNQESANLSSRWRFCSARIFWASLKSTFGPAFTGASCESTAPKTGSTVSFAWQHGQVTWRFSLERFPIAVLYSCKPKKEGHPTAADAPANAESRLESGLGWRVAAGETRCGAKLGTHQLRVRGRRSLWRRCGGCARLIRQRLAFHKHFHFVGVDDFTFEQRLRDAFERIPIVREELLRVLVAAVDDALHFLIDLDGGVFRIVAVLRDFAAEEDCFVFLAVGQRSQLAHTPFANHIARDVRGAFDVIASAGGDVAEENFFRRTPAHQHCQHGFQIIARVRVFVVFRQLH